MDKKSFLSLASVSGPLYHPLLTKSAGDTRGKDFLGATSEGGQGSPHAPPSAAHAWDCARRGMLQHPFPIPAPSQLQAALAFADTGALCRLRHTASVSTGKVSSTSTKTTQSLRGLLLF